MKFTVAIPAYKASYLKECIDSILAQTESDFELIIVNDASPEDLDSIVRLYTDPRIRYYTNAVNFGAENVVDNWNKCLSYARGEYFVLMGDDDSLELTYLEEFILLISKYESLDIFHCQSYIINEKSEKINITSGCPEFESTSENIWHRINFLREQFISDFVYRTAVLQNNGGFYKLPLAWGSDDISSYIAMGHKGIAHVSKPLLNYRRTSLTISSTGDFRLKMKSIILVKEWLNFFLVKTFDNEKDVVLNVILKKSIHKYTQKKKIQTMIPSYNKGLLYYFIFWIYKRKYYAVSLFEIVYSMIEFIKWKFSRRPAFK